MFHAGQTRRADVVSRGPSLVSVRVPRNVWSLGITSFLTDISSEMVVSVLPAYLVLHLGLTPMAFGSIDGVYQGATGVTRLLGGVIADKAQRHKEVAFAGYFISAVTKLLLILVTAGWAIASVIGLDRLGKGIRTAPRDALISLSVPRSQMAGAFGVHRALDTAGAALGPFTAFAILAFAPGAFDAVFMVSLIFAVLGLAALALLVHNPLVADAAVPAPRVKLSEMIALGKSRRFSRLVLSASVLSLMTISDGFLYLILQRQSGFDAAVVPLLFAGTAAGYFVTAVPLGRAADRFGRRVVFLCGYLFLLLAYGVGLLPAAPALKIALLLALMGAYYGATDGVLAALASECLPANLRSTGLAAMTTAMTLARLVSSILFGLVWTRWSAGTGLVIFAAGLAVALMVAASVLRPPVGEDAV